MSSKCKCRLGWFDSDMKEGRHDGDVLSCPVHEKSTPVQADKCPHGVGYLGDKNGLFCSKCGKKLQLQEDLEERVEDSLLDDITALLERWHVEKLDGEWVCGDYYHMLDENDGTKKPPPQQILELIEKRETAARKAGEADARIQSCQELVKKFEDAPDGAMYDIERLRKAAKADLLMAEEKNSVSRENPMNRLRKLLRRKPKRKVSLDHYQERKRRRYGKKSKS